MTKAIKRTILIFAGMLTFMVVACPGDAAINQIQQQEPKTPWTLIRQPTEVPWTGE